MALPKSRRAAKKRRTKQKIETSLAKLTLNESTVDPQTKESKLLTLPSEIRNRIYELVALSEPEVKLHMDCHICRPARCKSPSSIALLMTCKQIQREAYDIVWDNLRFKLDLEDLVRGKCTVPCRWLGSYEGAPILTEVRKLSIHFEPAEGSLEERKQIEERNDGLQAILLANENITSLELRTYGRLFRYEFSGSSDNPLLQSMTKGHYQEYFGHLLKVLKAKDVPVKLYDPGSKKMEEVYEFVQEDLGMPRYLGSAECKIKFG